MKNLELEEFAYRMNSLTSVEYGLLLSFKSDSGEMRDQYLRSDLPLLLQEDLQLARNELGFSFLHLRLQYCSD
jgi:hypothetical protein